MMKKYNLNFGLGSLLGAQNKISHYYFFNLKLDCDEIKQNKQEQNKTKQQKKKTKKKKIVSHFYFEFETSAELR
jgi:hypothetical protein